MYTSVLQNNPPWTHSPLLRHSLAKRSTLSWRVKHFNVIWRKLDQISQRSWLYKRRVCDQILFKIHWLYSLCQRNLQGEIQRGTERECENCCRYLQRKRVSWWRDNGKYSLKCRSLRFKIEKYILFEIRPFLSEHATQLLFRPLFCPDLTIAMLSWQVFQPVPSNLYN